MRHVIKHKYCTGCKENKILLLWTRKQKLCNKCLVEAQGTLPTPDYGTFLLSERYLTGTRRLRKPQWADTAAIEAFYQQCPEGYHVDHIIPLKGRAISGLHTLDNLQYLTKEQNENKSNKINLLELNNLLGDQT